MCATPIGKETEDLVEICIIIPIESNPFSQWAFWQCHCISFRFPKGHFCLWKSNSTIYKPWNLTCKLYEMRERKKSVVGRVEIKHRKLWHSDFHSWILLPKGYQKISDDLLINSAHFFCKQPSTLLMIEKGPTIELHVHPCITRYNLTHQQIILIV